MKTEKILPTICLQNLSPNSAEPRDHSRLMLLERETGPISHHRFFEIGQFFTPERPLVVNENTVFPARYFAPSCPRWQVELLLLKEA